MQWDLFYHLLLAWLLHCEEFLKPAHEAQNLGQRLKKTSSGAALWLPRQKHDSPKQRQGPFHPANSLTTAPSFLLAFDMLHFVPMTELQSCWGFRWAVEGSSHWRAEALLYSDVKLPSFSAPARVSQWVKTDSTFILLSMSQGVQLRLCDWLQLQGETMRSHCGMSCIISFNLKWSGCNLFFFLNFLLLVCFHWSLHKTLWKLCGRLSK